MVKKKIFLASQSPRRKEILRKMKINFRVVPSKYQEKPQRLSPARLVVAHAKGKALGAVIPSSSPRKRGSESLDSRFRGNDKCLVIGADTIVYAAGRILGKPKSVKEAAKMLTLLSGKRHFVYTGVAVRDLKSKKMFSGFAKTKVFVKKLTAEEIRKYIPKVNSLDKAGAYAVQMRPYIVTKTEGSYSNIVGLPQELLRKMLKCLKY